MTTTTRSKPYVPQVTPVPDQPGCYTVQSERYGPHLLYLVDLNTGICECEAGQKGIRCKHVVASRTLDYALKQARSYQGAEGLLELFR